MNVNNQTLLQVKAGHLPPDSLLKLLLEKKPNAFGFAVQNIENGKPDLAITREDATNMAFDDLKSLFVNAKDMHVIVYLAALHAGYAPEDIQPFVIHDSDDNPFISIFLEGDLVGNTEAGHTEHYSYVNGLLIPKITEWCNDFDGDLDKIAAKLQGDTFKKEFMMQVGHRAVLSILPCDGDVINLGKNDIGANEDWGSVSIMPEAPKPVEQKKPDVKAEEATPPKKQFWGGTKAKASVPATGSQTKPGEVVADAATKGTEKRTDGSAQITARPPSWTLKNDDVKLWYDIVAGVIHPQWKRRLPCVVVDFEAAKIDNWDEFRAYALNKKLSPSGATATSSGKVPAATAKADAKAISGVAGDKELPIIPAKDLEKVLNYVAKHIDGNSQSIIPPTEMQAIEQQLPCFAAAVGLEINETLNWPLAALIGIGNTDIRALALYAMQWRAIARPHVKVEVKTATSTTTTEKIGDNSIKQESISNEALPSEKKKFWGGKKAA